MNQSFKKKLSSLSKTLDHHLNSRLSSPTIESPQSSIQDTIINEPKKSDNDTISLINNNKPNTAEQDALGERVFKDFTNVFEKDGNIMEFEIIKVDSNLYNRSPVILIDHHIAIESWSIQALYIYLYNQLLNHNKKVILLNDNDLKQKSRLILLIKSSALFVWNIRKTLIEDGLLNVDDDLNLTKLILKHEPKSPECFVHREWILNHLSKSNNLTENYLNQELEICLIAADKYTSNYYSWNHRFNLVNKFFNNNLEFLISENELIKKWVHNHISDYSGYHYRQMIIGILFEIYFDSNEIEKSKKLLINENLNVKKLMQIYPEQEALFCHKRFLLKLKFLKIGLDQEDIDNEKKFVENSYELSSNFNYNWLKVLVDRYVRWVYLNFNIKIDEKKVIKN